MARLYDGESSYETSSYRHQFHGRGNLLSEYEIHCSHRFTSLCDFKQICNDFYIDLMDGDMEGDLQYLGFIHVKVGDIFNIDEIRSDIPKMTILYDFGEEILIVKFMVGVTHETCASLLQTNFVKVVQDRTGSMYSIIGVKSARFRGTNRMKEVDDAFKPRSRGLELDWPSIAFEVGVFESLTQLRQDVQFWLECSSGQTWIVIIAKVDKTARTIVIERWQDGGAQGQQQQPSQNMNVSNPYAKNCFPICIQALTLDEGQVYVGASLTIPVALIYDVLPRAQGVPFGPSDFEITAQLLNDLNDVFWDVVA